MPTEIFESTEKDMCPLLGSYVNDTMIQHIGKHYILEYLDTVLIQIISKFCFKGERYVRAFELFYCGSYISQPKNKHINVQGTIK